MLSSLKEEYATIEQLGAAVIAISQGSVEDHVAFCLSLGGCPFPVAADEGLEVARAYDAVALDGEQPVRAAYVLDEDGSIIHKIPFYQPGNVSQFLELFQAIGLE